MSEISVGKLIRSMADFPAPSGGVITLQNGVYNIDAALVTSDRFVIPDGSVVLFRGSDAFSSGITYTGIGTMFTGTDFVSFSLIESFYSAPNGTAVDFQSTAPSGFNFFMITAVFIDCVTLGTFKNATTMGFEFSAFQDIGIGAIFDTFDLFAMAICQCNSWKNQTTSMFTFQGANNELQMSNFATRPKSNESVFDIKSSSTMDVASITGSPVNLLELGSVFAAGSKNQTDINWNFIGNSNIPDSMAGLFTSFQNNALVTTIAMVDTPVKINAVWLEDSIITERFTFNSNGTMTYIGLESIDISIGAIATFNITGTKQLSLYVAKNGSVASSTQATAEVKNDVQMTVFGTISVVTNDTIELQVENNTDAVNPTVTFSTMKIG